MNPASAAGDFAWRFDSPKPADHYVTGRPDWRGAGRPKAMISWTAPTPTTQSEGEIDWASGVEYAWNGVVVGSGEKGFMSGVLSKLRSLPQRSLVLVRLPHPYTVGIEGSGALLMTLPFDRWSAELDKVMIEGKLVLWECDEYTCPKASAIGPD